MNQGFLKAKIKYLEEELKELKKEKYELEYVHLTRHDRSRLAEISHRYAEIGAELKELRKGLK